MEIIDTNKVLKFLEKRINTENFFCYLRDNSYYNSSDDFCYTFSICAVKQMDYQFFYDFLPNDYILQRNVSICLIDINNIEKLIAEEIAQEFFKHWVALILPKQHN